MDMEYSSVRKLAKRALAHVELSGLAKDIVEEWNLRIKQTPLEEAASLAFGSEYELGHDKVKVEKDGVNAALSLGHYVYIIV